MSIAYDDLGALLQFGLADRLQKALTISGTKSEDMADYLEVSRNTISNYINGRTAPKKVYLREWALKTGVPLSWLETGVFDDPDAPVGPAGIEPTTSTVESHRLAPVIPLFGKAA